MSCATIKATYADCGGIRGGLLLLLSSEFNSPDGGGGKKGFPVCLEYLNRLFFYRNHLLLRRLAVPPSLVLFYPTPCRHRSLNQRPIFSNFRKRGRARAFPSCATTKINQHFFLLFKNIGHTNLLFPSLLFPSSNYLIALQSK